MTEDEIALRRQRIAKRARRRRGRLDRPQEQRWYERSDTYTFDAAGSQSAGLLLDRTIQEMAESVSDCNVSDVLPRS